MTTSYLIEHGRVAFAIAHDPVCLRCGHGESLHTQSDIPCLACDQRASAGMPSLFCFGFLEAYAAPLSASWAASAQLSQYRK